MTIREQTPEEIEEAAALEALYHRYPYRRSQREVLPSMRLPPMDEIGVITDETAKHSKRPLGTDKLVKDRRGRVYAYFSDGSVRRVKQ